MRGLRIERTFRGAICRTTDPKTAEEYRQAGALVITDTVPDFWRYFAPVLEKTAGYQWLIKGEILYQFPEEWFADEWYDEKTDTRHSAKPVLCQVDPFEFCRANFAWIQDARSAAWPLCHVSDAQRRSRAKGALPEGNGHIRPFSTRKPTKRTTRVRRRRLSFETGQIWPFKIQKISLTEYSMHSKPICW
jgi:hypothetical protein